MFMQIVSRRTRRIAKALSASLLVVGILFVMTSLPAPDEFPVAGPVAATATGGYVPAPVLVDPRDPETPAPTF